MSQFTTWMTSRLARILLTSEPLIFGNPYQITAARYLRDVKTAREVIAECEHLPCAKCAGVGTEEDDDGPGDHICAACGGSGAEPWCGCFAGLNGYAVAEARQAWRLAMACRRMPR